MRYVLFLYLMAFAFGCNRHDPFDDRPFGFDFETDAELDYIHWECGELFRRSEDFAASGRYGLELQLFRGDSLGLKFYDFLPDWSRFERLVFRLRNANPETLSLYCRLEDREDPAPEEVFWRRFSVFPGDTTLSLKLAALTNARGRRPNLRNVEMVHLFLLHPARGTLLYFDDLHLE